VALSGAAEGMGVAEELSAYAAIGGSETWGNAPEPAAPPSSPVVNGPSIGGWPEGSAVEVPGDACAF